MQSILISFGLLLTFVSADPSTWEKSSGTADTTSVRARVVIDGVEQTNGTLAAFGPDGLINAVAVSNDLYSEFAVDYETTGEPAGNYFMIQISGNQGESHTLHFSPDGVTDITLTPDYTYIETDFNFYEFTGSMPPISSTETVQLVQGWNWISVSVESTQSFNDIFSDGFQANDEIKCSGGSALYYDNYGWFSQAIDIDSFASATMCKIYVQTATSASITGNPTTSKTYNLVQGWNWLGIPTFTQIKLKNWISDAGFEANDELKLQSGSALYYDNYGWFSQALSKDADQDIIVKANQGAKLYKQTAGSYTYTV